MTKRTQAFINEVNADEDIVAAALTEIGTGTLNEKLNRQLYDHYLEYVSNEGSMQENRRHYALIAGDLLFKIVDNFVVSLIPDEDVAAESEFPMAATIARIKKLEMVLKSIRDDGHGIGRVRRNASLALKG